MARWRLPGGLALRWLALLCVGTLMVWASPVSEIPGSGLRLDWRLELIIVAAITLAAVLLWVPVHIIPVVGTIVSLVVLIPIVEEFVFRYLLMYCWELGGRLAPAPTPMVMARALCRVSLVFAVAHLLIAVFSSLVLEPGGGLFRAPPGMQVGEALFIAAFTGALFLNFIYFHHLGLLVTMLYAWLAHIMVNAVLVAYNFVVNTFLGGSVLLHLGPRLLLGLAGAVFLWQCYHARTPFLGPFSS